MTAKSAARQFIAFAATPPTVVLARQMAEKRSARRALLAKTAKP